MKTYGLVGSSGTGKSYRAVGLANERGISCIIDDGLFIKGARILAGTSAKRESTKLSAIRRALFMDPDHAAKVREAIQEVDPASILILGTSIPMIERITQQLHLSAVESIISIEEVASEREISWARKQRREQGKHVIPVPTFQVRKDFSGFFIDPLRIFRVKGKGRHLETLEKTVVRPTYSYLGKFFISDSTIESIAAYCAQAVPCVSRVQRCSVHIRDEGITLELDLELIFGEPLHWIMQQVQGKIVDGVGYTTGLNILAVNVSAKRLVMPSNIS